MSGAPLMTNRANPLRRPLSSIVDAEAPPERLAVFRILTGVFTIAYLLIRSPVFLQLADRPAADFDGVGLFAVLDTPPPSALPALVLGLTVTTGAAATLGLRYRATAPAFAAGVLVLTTYRSSWGQLLHFENLFTLHLLILAFTPAADRFTVGRRRSALPERDGSAYGFPLALAGLVVVVTYVLAGVAKLRIGGVGWVTDDTVLHHIAYSAARLELLGGTPSPFAEAAVSAPWLLHAVAAVSVLIELGAPIVFLGSKLRTAWVAAAWSMHVGILALMFIAFPYPLTLVAFAPFFEIERLGNRWSAASGVDSG